tara:strand:- start:128 stop:670 length:543 start_codon:yes stop_codon:yes gene_type:complete
METHPKSYEDFRGKKIYKISGTADNASLVDKIQANKDYYYIFRCEDVHGHVSNPTHIYKVRLNSINEAAYLNVKVVKPRDVELEKTINQTKSKGLRQFVMIRPSIDQRVVNLPEDANFSTFKNFDTPMGPEMKTGLPNVWKKKFKLRIRSKQTGKEIDINFSFKNKILNDDKNNGDNYLC